MHNAVFIHTYTSCCIYIYMHNAVFRVSIYLHKCSNMYIYLYIYAYCCIYRYIDKMLNIIYMYIYILLYLCM